jgi:hypothetical protein
VAIFVSRETFYRNKVIFSNMPSCSRSPFVKARPFSKPIAADQTTERLFCFSEFNATKQREGGASFVIGCTNHSVTTYLYPDPTRSAIKKHHVFPRGGWLTVTKASNKYLVMIFPWL